MEIHVRDRSASIEISLSTFNWDCNEAHVVDAVGKNPPGLGKPFSRCPEERNVVTLFIRATIFSQWFICWISPRSVSRIVNRYSASSSDSHVQINPCFLVQSVRAACLLKITPFKLRVYELMNKSLVLRSEINLARCTPAMLFLFTCRSINTHTHTKKITVRDFLWLQSLIISYWSTSCTANCSRTCVTIAPGSTFTTLARTPRPWHPGTSRFSDIASPEAWSILHRKRYVTLSSASSYFWSNSRNIDT